MKLYRGWIVALAGAGVNLAMGIGYTWSIIVDRLTGELAWTQDQGALPYTVMHLVFALAMVFTGRLQDKIGPRPVIMAGGFFAGLGFLLSAFFLTPTGATIFFGFFFGIGLACCFSSATPAAIKWFPPSQRGKITGFVVSANGLSALFMSPIVFFLLENRGLYQGFIILGVGIIIYCLGLARLVDNPGEEALGFGIPAENEKKAAQKECAWREVLRQPQFYVLWLMFCLTSAAGMMFVTHLTRIATVHTGFEKSYLLVSLFACFSTAGRIAGGILSDRLGRVRAMSLIFALKSIMVILFIFIQGPTQIYPAVMLLGFTYGSLFALFPAANAAFFGTKNFGINYGMNFTALGVGALFGPLIAGRIFEQSGRFTSAFYLALGTALAALLLTFFIKAPAFPPDSDAS